MCRRYNSYAYNRNCRRYFSVANAMVSNFQMPLSTMLMLKCAYGGYELIMDAYNIALKENYRFGTYGDAMLILDK